MYYYGARYYNPRVSQWLSVDPIALYDPINEVEHYLDEQHNGGYFNPRNTSVYGYCYGNPVKWEDPNGKQNIVGAAIGAGVGALWEYGTQVTYNLTVGDSKTISDAFFNDIDFADVAISGGEGALAGFTSGASLLVTRGIAETAKASIDINGNGNVDIVGTEGSNKTGTSVLTEATIGFTMAGAGDLVGNAMKKSSNAGVKAAKSELVAAEKNLRKSLNTVANGNTNSKANSVLINFDVFSKAKDNLIEANSLNPVSNAVRGSGTKADVMEAMGNFFNTISTMTIQDTSKNVTKDEN